MPTLTAEYELVLMLDPELPDERRDQIAADARRRIEASGGLRSDGAWGMRKLAYEIRQRTEADYRFFRFENGGNLLDELSHNLKIADGVLRFRIFKVDPRSPVTIPPPPSPLASGGGPRGPRRGDDRGRRSDGPRSRPPREDPAASQPAEEAPAPAATEAAAPAATAEGEEAPGEEPSGAED